MKIMRVFKGKTRKRGEYEYQEENINEKMRLERSLSPLILQRTKA